MARISHTQEKSASSKPAKMYLEWKSNDKAFEFFDKDLRDRLLAEGKTLEEIKKGKLANVKVDLPFKFVFLQHYHTVKGFNDASNSGIWSNEVYYIGNEPMRVACKGGVIAEGIYKEIKPAILNAGGRYHRSIYGMLEDGSIVNISIKGAATSEWTSFMDDNKSMVDNQWIEINSASDRKKGSIKFSTPDFTLGDKLTKKDGAMADQAAAQLKAYLDEYFNKDQQSEQVEIEADDVEIDF